MSDRIKLSELVAARSRMTPGPYEGDLVIMSGQTGIVAEVDRTSDLEGIIATQNAADVLIEIAQAALALRDARNPDDPELRELYFIALDKVQP